MKRRLFALLGLMLVNSAQASDPVTIGKLIALVQEAKEQVSLMNESLEEYKEMTDLQQQITKIQQASLVKEVSELGSAMSGLVSELDQSRDLTEDIYGNVTTVDEQVATIANDVYSYAITTGESAWALTNSDAKGFGLIDEILMELGETSHLISKLDDQYWTGTPEVISTANDLSVVTNIDSAARESAEKVSQGLDVQDAQRVSAELLNSILVLLAQQNLRDISRDSKSLRQEAEADTWQLAEKRYFQSIYVDRFEESD